MRSSRFLCILFFTITALLITAGCAKEEPESDTELEPETASSLKLAPRSVPSNDLPEQQATSEPVILAERKTGELEGDGSGLMMFISAIDEDDFNQSLSLIAQDTSKEQYQALESSLRYLKHYNRWVQGKDERLMQLVDGKTGEEIIQLAIELQAKK